jgi:DNA-3-methyladenine glycosylase
MFSVSARVLARRLLGAHLVRRLPDGRLLVGRIVETEAYVGVKDAASHAYRGRRTPRNEAMYARAGTAYVYFTYGMHYCMNVVCAREGVPEAVLIRALEPVEGLVQMRAFRMAGAGGRRSALPDRDLCSGPARLCVAIAVDRTLNAVDLTESKALFIAGGAASMVRVLRTPRVGIGYSGEWACKPLRFLVSGNPHVSRPPSGAITKTPGVAAVRAREPKKSENTRKRR